MARSIACIVCICSAASLWAASAPRTVIVPREDPNAVLHNPDMGWVLYENYPLDQDPHGSSTLLTVPHEDFPDADTAALMLTWQDVEKEPDRYDFSAVDFACDYWRKRGKSIQLRLSSATLMWWANRKPPTGLGAPDYVLARMDPARKQVRMMEGIQYRVEDARDPFYRDRLRRFLAAVAAHFQGARSVDLIDLRGFGVWGEWHSGFDYGSVAARHDALAGVIDLWADAFPSHRLALSYSYDPDGPRALYAGTNKKFDERFTTNYAEFLRYSAFDHALLRTNVTFRRDGCGGAVHSNERKLCEEAFALGRAPMMCEFLGGYGQAKKAGTNWVDWMIEDALSLHPNYINLLGWQGADALNFTRERPDLVQRGLRHMGYRFVPVKIEIPSQVVTGEPFAISFDWVNRGVGRALRDYELWLRLAGSGDPVTRNTGALNTQEWINGRTNTVSTIVSFSGADGPGQLSFSLRDPATRRAIALPLEKEGSGEWHAISTIAVRSARDPRLR